MHPPSAYTYSQYTPVNARFHTEAGVNILPLLNCVLVTRTTYKVSLKCQSLLNESAVFVEILAVCSLNV